jgi:ABC-type multidrug transport system fused ATPase/permease subunit
MALSAILTVRQGRKNVWLSILPLMAILLGSSRTYLLLGCLCAAVIWYYAIRDKRLYGLLLSVLFAAIVAIVLDSSMGIKIMNSFRESSYRSQLSVFTSGRANFWVNDLAAFSEHALYIRDMEEFLNYVPKIKENENGRVAKPGVIKFENVSFSYVGSSQKALDNVSFTLNPNERVALVGCNGAGKSTIVKLLLHLYEPSEGRITLDGIDIKEYNLTSYRSMFATMFQDYKCFSMTVAES